MSRRNIAVLMAHPDDEFACSMPMQAMVRAGDTVHCIYLTNGGFGGQSVSRRRKESLDVLRALGVGSDQVHFLGESQQFEDGRLHTTLTAAASALVELLGRLESVDILYLPAWEGGHQDHDATHLLGVVVAEKMGITKVRQVPLYNGAGLPGPWFRVLRPLPENGPVHFYRATPLERIRAVALCLRYISQWKTWTGLLPFFALRMLLDGRFPEQEVRFERILERPHVGAPLYERRGFLSASDFRAAANEFLARC